MTDYTNIKALAERLRELPLRQRMSFGDEAADAIESLLTSLARAEEFGALARSNADACIQMRMADAKAAEAALLTANEHIAELERDGPTVIRGTTGTEDKQEPWYGTMRQVINDYRIAADAEATAGDEARKECSDLRHDIERLVTTNSELATECNKLGERCKVLESALTLLVTKLDEIENDEQFKGIWGYLFAHNIVYGGPNWKDELAAARAAIGEPHHER